MTRYRPDIDGLRAIAVLSVVFFHLAVPGFSGGYVGVDVFFVISGFLITRNILDKDFSFGAFYTRRIRRLFPAMFVTVTATWIAGCILMSPHDLENLSRSVVYTLGALANVFFWRVSIDYFQPAADMEPLLHMWSLAVEEQFYLVWPALLLLVAPLGRKAIVATLVAVCALSFGLLTYWVGDTAAKFYLTPFRVFELGIGAVAVFAVLHPFSNSVKRALLVIGLAAIASAVIYLDRSIPFPSAWTLLPCLGAALVIIGGNEPTIGRLLSNRPAIWVGLISYSLYLVHWPLLSLYRYTKGAVDLSITETAALFLLSVAVAAGMYRFVETPFRIRGAQRTAFYPAIGVAAALVITVSVPATFAARQGGWDWRLTPERREIARLQTFAVSPCRDNGDSTCSFGEVNAPVGLYILGDSYAHQYVGVFDALLKSSHLSGRSIYRGSCPALVGLMISRPRGPDHECAGARDRLLTEITTSTAPVFIGQAWDGYANALIADSGTAIASSSESERLAAWSAALDRTIAILGPRTTLLLGRQITNDCHIEPRALRPGPFSASAAACKPTGANRAAAEAKATNSMLTSVQARHSNVRLLLPEQFLCYDGSCPVVANGIYLYQDKAHFTLAGAEMMAKRAGPLLDLISQRRQP